MISKETKETIACSTVPIILGNGVHSIRLAWRLYQTIGTASIRLGATRRPSEMLQIFCIFRKAAKNERLLLEQLSDISLEFEDYLLLLIPTDEPSRRFVKEHRETLSARFILSAPNEVLEHIPYLKG